MPGSSKRGRPPLSQNMASSRSGSRRHTPTLMDYTHSPNTQFRDESDSECTGYDESWKSAIESFQSTVQRSMEELQRSISKLENDLGKAVEFQSKRIDVLETKMTETQNECDALHEKVAVLESSLESSFSEINKLERMSRRNNFRVVGIPVSEGEICEDLLKEKVFPLFGDNLDIQIERCHRDGRGYAGRPPHILVRCLSYQSKVFIMKRRRASLEGQSFFIVDDLTRPDLEEKKKWAPKVKELYERGVKLRFSGGKWRDATGKPFAF